MAPVFKSAATEQLKLLMVVFLMASAYLMPLRNSNPAANNPCGRELYLRLDITHDLLRLATLTAAMLLLTVRMAVATAEANVARAKTFGAAVEVEGLACVAAGWKRFSLRALLLLATGVSLAVSFLAVQVIRDGFLYRTGCAGGTGSGSAMAVAMMSLMALVHGVFAWAAVSQN